jgi:hypothetical protein
MQYSIELRVFDFYSQQATTKQAKGVQKPAATPPRTQTSTSSYTTVCTVTVTIRSDIHHVSTK